MTPDMARRVLVLARGGTAPKDIVVQTGLPAKSVRAALQRARRNGEPLPRFTRGRGYGGGSRLTVPLPAEAHRALAVQGLAFGLSAPALAARLLTVILRDGLVGAVMDGDGQ